MYIFFFVYFYILRKVIKLLNGNYVDSLSSYSLLLSIFSPCDNFLDIIFITLAAVSSIHHSIRDQPSQNYHKIIHASDSALISCITSYFIFCKINYFPITISSCLSLLVFYVEYMYRFTFLKKFICGISAILSLYVNKLFIVPLCISLFFFSNSPKWSENNFYRFGWHFSASAYIILYMMSEF